MLCRTASAARCRPGRCCAPYMGSGRKNDWQFSNPRIDTDVALYHRCQSRPISESIITARWQLFGHVLRLPRDAPAQRAIDHYFADTEAAMFRGRPRTSLPTTLCSDLRPIGRTLRQPADIEALHALSREQWRQMERDISA